MQSKCPGRMSTSSLSSLSSHRLMSCCHVGTRVINCDIPPRHIKHVRGLCASSHRKGTNFVFHIFLLV